MHVTDARSEPVRAAVGPAPGFPMDNTAVTPVMTSTDSAAADTKSGECTGGAGSGRVMVRDVLDDFVPLWFVESLRVVVKVATSEPVGNALAEAVPNDLESDAEPVWLPVTDKLGAFDLVFVAPDIDGDDGVHVAREVDTVNVREVESDLLLELETVCLRDDDGETL